MPKIRIISVDFQNDFSARKGKHYRPRPCVKFIKNKLVPFLRKNNLKVSEIVSDYRQPRPGDKGDCCHPGEWGYLSEISQNVKTMPVWVKCMNSPIWTRKGIGNPKKKPGLPRQDPEAFGKWLEKTVGKPEKAGTIILVGLTLDCCVFSTAQELNWRAYDVRILEEAVDTYSGSRKEKQNILNNPPLTNWAKGISWKQLQKKL